MLWLLTGKEADREEEEEEADWVTEFVAV